MKMNTLLKEIRILIALKCDDLFYTLYRIDPDITEYARTEEGKRAYISIALKCEQTPVKTTHKLFGKYQSVYDMPAVIYPTIEYNLHQFAIKLNFALKPIDYQPSGFVNMSRAGDMSYDNIIYDNQVDEPKKNIHLRSIESLNDLVYSHGASLWYHRGVLHRGDDLPAIIHADNGQEWYTDGVRIKQLNMFDVD